MHENAMSDGALVCACGWAERAVPKVHYRVIPRACEAISLLVEFN